LPTHADPKTVRRRQRQVRAALEAGADVDVSHSLPVWAREMSVPPSTRSWRTRTIGLIDEVFWLWGGSASGCGCVGTLHA
jgi:hypothetical protein